MSNVTLRCQLFNILNAIAYLHFYDGREAEDDQEMLKHV
jgi:hypothetical protein